MKRLILLFLLSALPLVLPHRADAQTVPNCSTLGLPNPVVLQVGDTQTNLMHALGRQLRDNKTPDGTPNPTTLLFITSGSCTNIAAIYPPTVTIKAGTKMQYIQSQAELPDPNWSLTTPVLTCALDADQVPDVANSALFNSACVAGAPPASVQLTQGPTQAYVMAVPLSSPATAITFEEAYFVFGFGKAGMIAPWIDETQMFIRTTTKSTLLAWAANITVPAARWKGVPFDGSPMVVANVQTGMPSAIGILGAEVYDANRATMKALAFRAKGQYAAYFPDSSSSARDKQNVRDGHYTVWSPTIWMDTIDANSQPINASARYVIDLIAGKSVTPAPSFPMINVVAQVGLVPICAMHVNRDFEGGPLSPFAPTEDCTCKYESLVDVPPSCATCSATTTCATGVCRNGYCEAN